MVGLEPMLRLTFIMLLTPINFDFGYKARLTLDIFLNYFVIYCSSLHLPLTNLKSHSKIPINIIIIFNTFHFAI